MNACSPERDNTANFRAIGSGLQIGRSCAGVPGIRQHKAFHQKGGKMVRGMWVCAECLKAKEASK